MRWLLTLMVLGGAIALACGGDDSKNTSTGDRGPTATPRPAADRPSMEEQLAIIDGSRSPDEYREVLDRLAQRCREPRTEIADSVVEARQTLDRERGVKVSVIDYLRGVERVIPAGQERVGCREIAVELGRTIGGR